MFIYIYIYDKNIHLSSPHTTGGSGRGGARRGGGAWRGRAGRAGRDADGSVRPEYNRPFYPPDHRKNPEGMFVRVFSENTRFPSGAYASAVD